MAAFDHSKTVQPTTPERLRARDTRLRLQTIIRLRWLAVLGQSVTVIGAYWVLGIDLAKFHGTRTRGARKKGAKKR